MTESLELHQAGQGRSASAARTAQRLDLLVVAAVAGQAQRALQAVDLQEQEATADLGAAVEEAAQSADTSTQEA